MNDKSVSSMHLGDVRGDGAAQVARLVAEKGGASPESSSRHSEGRVWSSKRILFRKKFVIGRLDFHRGILKTIELGTASSFCCGHQYSL